MCKFFAAVAPKKHSETQRPDMLNAQQLGADFSPFLHQFTLRRKKTHCTNTAGQVLGDLE